MKNQHEILEKSRLGRLLVNRGLITDSELDFALSRLPGTGQRLGEFLIGQGLISERDLNRTLARQRRTRYVAAFFAALLAPIQPFMALSASAATSTSVSTLSILSQPTSTSGKVGGSAAFSAKVSGPGTISYLWWKDGKKFKTTSTADLTFSNLALSDAGTYQLKAYSGTLVKWSQKVTLSVAQSTTSTTTSTASNSSTTTTATSISITSQPQSTSGEVGGSAAFSPSVSGPSNMTYLWWKDGRKLKTTPTPELAFSNLSMSDGGTYQLKAYSGTLVKWSQKVTLSVAQSTTSTTTSTASSSSTTTTATSISITSQPQSTSGEVGGTAAFSPSLSGPSNMTYLWWKDGRKLTTTPTPELAFSNLSLADGGTYQLKAYSGTLVKWSQKVTLTVKEATTTPAPAPTTPEPTSISITSQPQSTSGEVGGTAAFNPSVSGPSDMIYLWWKDGRKFKTTPTPELAFTNLADADGGTYQLKAYSGTLVKWSTKVGLTVKQATTVQPSEPVVVPDIAISLQPVGTSLYSGKSYTLNVSASGSGTLTYQWRKNGTPIPNAVLPYLNFDVLSLADAGMYDVVITNSKGPVTSQQARLDVTIDRTARLRWTAPTTRVNGTPLAANEISGYRIYHSDETGSIETTYDVSANQLNYDLADLVGGRHYFAISAIDTKGLESELSNVSSKDIRTQ